MKAHARIVPSLLLALAGNATTLAQPTDVIIPPDRALPITPGMIVGGNGIISPTPYGSRVDLNVYNVGIPSETGGDWRVGGFVVYDDVTFSGPYISNSTPLVLNGMSLGFITPQSLPPIHGDHLYTRISFYPNHDSTVANTAYPYGGTPVVATLDWGAGWSTSAAPNIISYYPAPITFPSFATLSTTNVFNNGPTDRSAGVKIEIFNDAALTVRATDWALVRRGLINFLAVGTSDPYGWYSSAADAQIGEVQNINRTGGGANGTRATYMGFQGTGFGCGVPCNGGLNDLGSLTDGLTTTNGIVATNNAIWYVFTLAAPATDDAGSLGQFLDIDTEGSTAPFAIALYHGDQAAETFGSVLLSDNGSGSGTQSQLSFGMGRRTASGDGEQYDGRGFLSSFRGLPAGTYYVVIAPAGSTFLDGFNINATGPGGPFTLRLRTNVNGTPAAPSVAPLADADLGSVVGTAFAAPAIVNRREVRWVSFSTPLSASPANAVTISLESPQTASSSITLFNSSGNLVASSVSLSPTPTAPLVFNTAGSLPAGNYHAAITYGQRDLALSPITNGRWHVRNTANLNGFTFGLRVQTGWTSTCGSADFNGDGDSGTDTDIEAFFNCLAGNCCPTCWELGSDFDGNGDFGTDQDIEAFFRVLAGGAC